MKLSYVVFALALLSATACKKSEPTTPETTEATPSADTKSADATKTNEPAAKPAVKAQPPIAGKVDPKNSQVIWTASKITGAKHTGRVNIQEGDIQVEGDVISGGNIVFDLNSIDVTDLKGDDKKKFLTHIKSEDFFEVEKFPSAKLMVTKSEAGKLHGNLTIKGKTKPVVFPYVRTGQVYRANIKIDRTKWGLTYGSKSFFKNLGDKVINDEISFTIAMVVNKV